MDTLKAYGLPGGGACTIAPTNTHKAGDRVTVSSASKGERPCTLGACLGTIAHPFLGPVDLFTYKADK